MELAAIGGSALTGASEVPKDSRADRPDQPIPVTYVPARNTIFLSYALAWAEVLAVREIFIGVTAVDYSGYPDCRPEYIHAFEVLAKLATKTGVEGNEIHIRAPLIHTSKADIIRKGLSLGVDYGIYMMSRLRDEMRETGGNWKSALQNTLSTTGSGVLVSVVVLLGSLVPLMSTELANTWAISLYIGEALILDVIMALMFLPLMVYWLKPGFVFRVNK